MTCRNGISDKPTHVGDGSHLKRGLPTSEDSEGTGSPRRGGNL
jgi:hypothetical protein